MTTIDDLPPLREVIRRHDLRAKKSLGQNYLLDLNLTARIARAAGPLAGVTVVEIGPGPGGLTRALLANGARRVIAVERDERALAALAEIAAHYPGRLDVDCLSYETVCRLVEKDLARLRSPPEKRRRGHRLARRMRMGSGFTPGDHLARTDPDAKVEPSPVACKLVPQRRQVLACLRSRPHCP